MKAEEKTSAEEAPAKGRKQAVKKRRRKSPALKWVLITGAGLLVILFISLFVVIMMVRSWLHGEGFKERMVAVAESSLKAKVNLGQVNWEGASIYIGAVEAQGYRESAIARLNIDGVRGTFDGARDKAWQIPNITMNQLSVEFSDDHLAQRADIAIEEDPNAGLNSAPRFVRRWVPQRTEVGLVRIDATNLVVKNSAGSESFVMRAIETASKPISGSRGGWRIQGRGGEMLVAGLPEFQVEDFDLRWTGGEVYVNRAAFGAYGSAHVEADGELLFGDHSEMNLRLNITGLDSADVLNESWQERLTATLSGEVVVTGDFTTANGLVQSGSLSLAKAVLKELPILKKIATYTQSPRFHPLVLHQASLDFERHGDHLVIRNLVLQSDGLTRLEGGLTLQGDVIQDGRFRLGVTPGTLSLIPGAERKVFVESDGGFLWTDVEVAGTLGKPQENLTQRLVRAGVEAVIEETPGKVLDTAKDAITDPAATAGDLLEQGTKALKGFSPFLK